MRHPDGRLVAETHFRHDAAGRLASVWKDNDAPAVYSYDANGRRRKLELPNGVFTEYEYDSLMRLKIS